MAHLRFIMRAAKFAYTFALFRDWTEVVGFTASLQITTQLTLNFSVYCEIVYDAFVERTVRINFSEKQNPAAVCQGKKQKKKWFTLVKDIFRPVTSVGQRKKSESPTVREVYYEVHMTRVLHTARISDIDSVMFVNRVRNMASFELGKK